MTVEAWMRLGWLKSPGFQRVQTTKYRELGVSVPVDDRVVCGLNFCRNK